MTHGEYSAQENFNSTIGKFGVCKSIGESSGAQIGCEENSVALGRSAQSFAA